MNVFPATKRHICFLLKLNRIHYRFKKSSKKSFVTVQRRKIFEYIIQMFNFRQTDWGAYWTPFSNFQMPRSRRRHHSRSRSRSRSHSHERDREPKRRKIDGIESPALKRSVSSEPESPKIDLINKDEDIVPQVDDKNILDKSLVDLNVTPTSIMSPKQTQKRMESEKKRMQKEIERVEREKKKLEEKERLRLEREKQKMEKNKEREEKEEQKRKEREEKEELRRKEKEEKDEQKRKEKEEKDEQKRKEKEEKEAKRKEREEREEIKRKEREQEKLKKQLELDEKMKEKQKLEEQKQKTASAFVNFFVPKKLDKSMTEKEPHMNFMPFQIKTDMKLAPNTRGKLSEKQRTDLVNFIKKQSQNASYLADLKSGKTCGKSGKTWPLVDDEIILIEEEMGDQICEDTPKKVRMRAKYLKFHDNRRPAYFGTWRKKSKLVTPRRPFLQDGIFDYDYDSDDDWEEEEQGESLENKSDDEGKDNEAENDDYEVDNEFFVPHGHLSDDEIDDEANARLSPESLKQKLKLLKDEFDQDIKAKTNRMKPRSIGCVWYGKNGDERVDEAIDRYLKPFAMITNAPILIKKRLGQLKIEKAKGEVLKDEFIPNFLKFLHGKTGKQGVIKEFMQEMENNGHVVFKRVLGRTLKNVANFKKCLEEGPLFNKYCWMVKDEIQRKYNVELNLPKIM